MSEQNGREAAREQSRLAEIRNDYEADATEYFGEYRGKNPERDYYFEEGWHHGYDRGYDAGRASAEKRVEAYEHALKMIQRSKDLYSQAIAETLLEEFAALTAPSGGEKE